MGIISKSSNSPLPWKDCQSIERSGQQALCYTNSTRLALAPFSPTGLQGWGTNVRRIVAHYGKDSEHGGEADIGSQPKHTETTLEVEVEKVPPLRIRIATLHRRLVATAHLRLAHANLILKIYLEQDPKVCRLHLERSVSTSQCFFCLSPPHRLSSDPGSRGKHMQTKLLTKSQPAKSSASTIPESSSAMEGASRVLPYWIVRHIEPELEFTAKIAKLRLELYLFSNPRRVLSKIAPM
jgi:hypothetical protein